MVQIINNKQLFSYQSDRNLVELKQDGTAAKVKNYIGATQDTSYQRVGKGVLCLFATVMSLGLGLFSEHLRDGWRQALLGKRIYRVMLPNMKSATATTNFVAANALSPSPSPANSPAKSAYEQDTDILLTELQSKKTLTTTVGTTLYTLTSGYVEKELEISSRAWRYSYRFQRNENGLTFLDLTPSDEGKKKIQQAVEQCIKEIKASSPADPLTPVVDSPSSEYRQEDIALLQKKLQEGPNALQTFACSSNYSISYDVENLSFRIFFIMYDNTQTDIVHISIQDGLPVFPDGEDATKNKQIFNAFIAQVQEEAAASNLNASDSTVQNLYGKDNRLYEGTLQIPKGNHTIQITHNEKGQRGQKIPLQIVHPIYLYQNAQLGEMPTPSPCFVMHRKDFDLIAKTIHSGAFGRDHSNIGNDLVVVWKIPADLKEISGWIALTEPLYCNVGTSIDANIDAKKKSTKIRVDLPLKNGTKRDSVHHLVLEGDPHRQIPAFSTGNIFNNFDSPTADEQSKVDRMLKALDDDAGIQAFASNMHHLIVFDKNNDADSMHAVGFATLLQDETAGPKIKEALKIAAKDGFDVEAWADSFIEVYGAPSSEV
jgi:hypothetical protein